MDISKTLFVTDLDGTLLNNRAEVTQETVEILNELIGAGMMIAYATARSWHSAYKITKEIHFSTPCSTYNGTFLVSHADGKKLDTRTLDRASADFYIDHMVGAGLYPMVDKLEKGREKVVWVAGRENDGLLRYIQSREGDERLSPVSDPAVLKEGETYYISAIGEKHEMLELYHGLQLKTDCHVCLQEDTYTKGEYWIEVYRKDASKAFGVKRLQSLMGAETVVCFGDNANDIPMFQISDACYAVENAIEPLKELATGILLSNEENGVARFLRNAFYGL